MHLFLALESLAFSYSFTVAFLQKTCYNRFMKNNKQLNEAKYFKYNFTRTMFLLAIVALLLCFVGMIISIYRVFHEGIHSFLDVLQSPLLILICIFGIFFILAFLIKSQYIVDGKHYTAQFGFIKSRFLIKDVTAIELNSDTQKLTVFVGEQYMILSILPTQNDAFVQAMRDVNKNIDFSFTLATAEDEQNKKK